MKTRKENNNLTELVFILDRSGSMSGLESDTIGGFNAMIQKQKKESGEAYVSTILFDNVTNIFFCWVFGFGGKVKIISPDDVKTDFKNMVLKIAEEL